VLSETLGLLASAFDHQARFVLGAMVRVGDWEAALIGCAFQYALQQQRQHAGAMDWAACFVQLQAQVRAGHWPSGFVAALEPAWRQWCKEQRQRGTPYQQQALRYQLNRWLQAQGLNARTVFQDADWDADWRQLAQATQHPSPLVQDTMAWYVAHGVG
jgi:hypothetical protein